MLVSPAAPPAAPHGMRARPVDAARAHGRDRALDRDRRACTTRCAAAANRFSGVFVDSARSQSDRALRLRRDRTTSPRTGGAPSAELIEQGYADAYRQFIEPVGGGRRCGFEDRGSFSPRP